MCDHRRATLRRVLFLSVAVLSLLAAPALAQTPYQPGPASNGSRTAVPSTPAAGQAVIVAQVPADAEVWVEDQRMTQTGPQRRFVSPPLPKEDSTYFYNLRVRWMENGQPVERSRRVYFRAGDQVSVHVPLKADNASASFYPSTQQPAAGSALPIRRVTGTPISPADVTVIPSTNLPNRDGQPRTTTNNTTVIPVPVGVGVVPGVPVTPAAPGQLPPTTSPQNPNPAGQVIPGTGPGIPGPQAPGTTNQGTTTTPGTSPGIPGPQNPGTTNTGAAPAPGATNPTSAPTTPGGAPQQLPR